MSGIDELRQWLATYSCECDDKGECLWCVLKKALAACTAPPATPPTFEQLVERAGPLPTTGMAGAAAPPEPERKYAMMVQRVPGTTCATCGGAKMALVPGYRRRVRCPDCAGAAAPPRQERCPACDHLVSEHADDNSGCLRSCGPDICPCRRAKPAQSLPPAEAAPMRPARDAREVAIDLFPDNSERWDDATETLEVWGAEWAALVEAARRGVMASDDAYWGAIKDFEDEFKAALLNNPEQELVSVGASIGGPLLAMLRELEWEGAEAGGDDAGCPWCRAPKAMRIHAPDCRLDALLRKYPKP